MDWLEQNLDAYRIIGEILNDLRSVVRERLEAGHGKTWYKSALPPGLLDSLIELKEHEKAIDWYESEYQQVMSYAVFPDLLQILEHNPDLFAKLTRLAPTNALLHARFMELEVMRAKLGRARPISDTELAFLGTFHLRFRKAIDEARDDVPTPVAGTPPPPSAPQQAATGHEESPPAPKAGATPPAAAEPAASSAPETPPPEPPMDGSGTDPNLWEDETAPQLATLQRPPQRLTEKRPEKADEPIAEEKAHEEGEEAAPAAEGEAAKRAPTIDDALAESDDQAVLHAFYHEVTHIAEDIWSKEVLPSTKVWDKVSVSGWYERNFSRLGLKPLSDFYEVISKVDRKMRDGTGKQELQQYLKECNFAQVLLALRDVFQRNQV